MIRIDNICVSYRSKGTVVPVLKNLSLQLEQGEILAVLGSSGCGKSTLIQVLAGMLPADSGTVMVNRKGVDTPHNPRTQKIAVIPQSCGLLPWKTVRQNCLLPLKLHHLRIDEQKLFELEEACRSLEVISLLDRYPHELSGGQAQRVALIRAFLQEPDLLLMDEPFSSLDAITRGEAWELFLKVWRQKQPTAILATHSIEEAMYLGRKVSVLDGQQGKFKEEMDNPYFGQPEPEQEEFLRMRRGLKEALS